MTIALPPNWLSTDDAIDDLRTADAEWQKLHAAREASLDSVEARPKRAVLDKKSPEYDKTSPEFLAHKKTAEGFLARTHKLTTDVIASIAARELVAVWLVEVNGIMHEREVPRHYWDSPHSDTAIETGSYMGLLVSPDDYKRFAKAPLCFRRAEWEAWLDSWKRRTAASKAESDLAIASTLKKLEIKRRLEDEIAHRKRAGQPHGRDVMALWIKGEFPNDLTVDDARDLVEGLDPELRAQPGAPKGPRKPRHKP